MTNANVLKTWQWSLGDLAKGGRSIECVEAFDRFTSDMLGSKRISLEEFLAAQTVIGAALAGAKMLRRAA